MLRLIQRISQICVICLTISSTAQTDTLCFEINEARNILKFAEKGYFCDSIIQYKNEQDSILRETIQIKDRQLSVSINIIDGQNLKIRRLKTLSGGVRYCVGWSIDILSYFKVISISKYRIYMNNWFMFVCRIWNHN